MAQKRTPAASLLLYFFHWHTLSKWIKEGNISALGLRYFDKQYQKRLKGNRDPCAPRKSIESDYLEWEQVESQGGPCHVRNLSLLHSGHSCQPCKCSVRVIREQRSPDRAQPTSRRASPLETRHNNKPQHRVRSTLSASPLARWTPSVHNQEPSCVSNCRVNDIQLF